MEPLLFAGWDTLARTLLLALGSYAGLLLLLRGAGKRTLSKMNAFDFIVTVALGSMLATLALSRNVPLLEGLAAMAALVGLQFAVTWSSVRWPRVRTVVTGEPLLLLHAGEPIPAAMKRARVTLDELRMAAREAGMASLAEVGAAVLETDGSVSMLPRAGAGPASTLARARRPGD